MLELGEKGAGSDSWNLVIPFPNQSHNQPGEGVSGKIKHKMSIMPKAKTFLVPMLKQFEVFFLTSESQDFDLVKTKLVFVL